jgi:hypothetical protein
MAKEADRVEDAGHTGQSYENTALTFADTASERSLKNWGSKSINKGRKHVWTQSPMVS